MRASHILSAAAAALYLTAGAVPAAGANPIVLNSCSPGVPQAAPWRWVQSPGMRAEDFCATGDGMIVGSWASATSGAYTHFQLRTPPSVGIRRVRGEIRLMQGSGWLSGLVAEDLGAWYYGGPVCHWQCGNGVFTGFDLTFPDIHLVGLRFDCVAASCPSGISSALRNVEVTLEDPVAPAVQITGGTLASGRWLRGDASLEYVARDEGGVRRLEVYVDGQRVKVSEPPCGGVGFPACSAGVGDDLTLPTRLLNADGAHRVNVRAVDLAGNVGEQAFNVNADNTAPIAPLALTSGTGEWRSDNRFSLRWQNPTQRAVAPITGARWRMCPTDGPSSACVTGARDGAGIAALDDVKLPGLGHWQLELALVDAAGNVDLSNASTVRLGYDDTPPDLAIVPSDPQDPTRLSVAATDATSGIAGGTVELHKHNTRTWRPVPTVVTPGGLEATIDDELLSAGDYDVRAVAVNAAGLERSTTAWTSGQAALLTLPLRIATRARLGAARKRAGGPRARAVLVRRPVIGYGRRVRLTGQLLAPGGNPLAGVPIHVSSRIDGPNTAWRPDAELRTDRTGHFRYLVARGPSRVIRFRYPGTATTRSLTRDVPVRVRASSTIRASRHRLNNGEVVRFRGQIRGGHLPARKRVELQYFARGKWRTFASTRADGRGRWGYSYRFDGSRGVVTWRFRALITAETGYPYATGRSGRVSVTVVGLP